MKEESGGKGARMEDKRREAEPPAGGDRPEDDERKYAPVYGLAIGMGLGVSLGVVFGNVGLGISMGLLFGVAVGAVFGKK